MNFFILFTAISQLSSLLGCPELIPTVELLFVNTIALDFTNLQTLKANIRSLNNFLLGFFLDWVEITLIILPFLAPVMVDLGVDLVWFIVMFAVVLQTSFITPPVGFALFYMKGVAPQGISITNIYKGIIPFVILQVIAVAIVFNFPEIVTWLPKVAYGP